MTRTEARSGLDRGMAGSASRPGYSFVAPLARALTLVGLVAGLAAGPAQATGSGSGGSYGSGGSSHQSCGKSAKADGNDQEWDRRGDYAKAMHKDGRDSSEHSTDLHLRCDPDSGKVHALVTVKDGYSMEDSSHDWIKVDGKTVSTKGSKDFAWVYKNGKRVGYECSFGYDFSKEHKIEAHAKVSKSGKTHYAGSGDYQHRFDCQQDGGNDFEQDPQTGLVCFQAEDFGAAVSAKIGTKTYSWSVDAGAPVGADGDAVIAGPNLGALVGAGSYSPDKSPRLDFPVKFNKTGTHYFWARSWLDGDGDNSLHQGLDGKGLSDGLPRGVEGTTYDSWHWVEGVPFNVATKGSHAVNVWMREDGVRLDEICVTSNPSYDPNEDDNPPAGDSQQASCGYADIDGSLAEWDLAADLFAPMVKEGTATGTADLYVRYDEETETAYVLALARSGYVAINYLPWNWVSLDGKTVVAASASKTATFAWVKQGSTLMGYEASFHLVPGDYQKLHAQLKTAPANNVNAHFKSTSGDLPLTADCGASDGDGDGGQCAGKTAAVDGQTGEWDLTGDLLTPMAKEGTSTQSADLYVRYDAASGRAWVLALARSGYVAIDYLPWNFVQLNGKTVVSATNDTKSTSFRWVYRSGTRIGYEASFALPAGTSPSAIFAQLKTAPASNTSQHFKSQGSGSVATQCSIPVPGGDGGCGAAQVDGGYGDWDLQGDFYAAMYEAGDSAKTRLSDFYFRYDRTSQTAYVLVLTRDGFEAEGEAWVKIYDQSQSAIPFTDFAWVKSGTKTVGYEAAFTLAPGSYSEVEVHVNVKSGRTSSTGKKASPISLTTPDCAAPAFVAIGNQLWVESGAQAGYQSGEDSTVAGVVVELYDAATGTKKAETMSGADGCWLFDNLSEGSYYAAVPAFELGDSGKLAGHLPLGNPGSDESTDDGGDHNGSLDGSGNLRTGVFALAAGGEPTGERLGSCGASPLADANVNLTADLAVVAPAPPTYGLGNLVFKDENANGRFDSGDTGLSGLALEVLDAGGKSVGSAVTGTGGCWYVDGLPAGAYSIRIPGGQSAVKGLEVYGSAPGGGADDDLEQDGIAVGTEGEVRTDPVTLGGPFSVTDERLYGCEAAGSDDSNDLTLDVAYVQTYGLGNQVWVEGNGTRGYQAGTDDRALEGVAVQVFKADGTQVGADMVTGPEGCWYVDGLPAGSYYVQVPAGQAALAELKADLATLGSGAAADDDTDHNGEPQADGSLRTNSVALGSGTAIPMGEGNRACAADGVGDAADNLTLDISLVPIPKTYGLGNQVWLESGDAPGFDGADSALDGVEVQIYRKSQDGGADALVDTLTTSAQGCWYKDGLLSGDYYAAVPAGAFASGGRLFGLEALAGAGSSDLIDDDQDHNATQAGHNAALVTDSVALGEGSQPTGESNRACAAASTDDARDNLSLDMALKPQLVAIGNRVWREGSARSPGYQPAEGDAPLPNVQVLAIETVTGNQYQAVTDGNGCWLAKDLPAGSYVVAVPAGQAAIGDLEGFAIDPATAYLAGDDETTDDAADQNGLQLGAGGDLETQVYQLAPGTEPEGESSGSACGLSAGLPDANVNETADIALQTPHYGIGNQVWIETNGQPGFQAGAQDGDLPAAGVTVGLYRRSPDTLVEELAGTSVTDAQGCWLVDGLEAGSYVARISAADLAEGGPLFGTDPASAYSDLTGTESGLSLPVDDDADQNGRPEPDAAVGGVRSQAYDLMGPQPVAELETGSACAHRASALDDERVNLTADFAFDRKVAVGNLIWIEANNLPGYQSAGAAGIDLPVPDGVLVVLRNADTEMTVKTTYTAGGFYLFDRLSPGRYYVQIPASEFVPADPADPTTGGKLAGYVSAPMAGGVDETPATDDGNGQDAAGDENGVDADPIAFGIASDPFELGAGSEPTAATGETGAKGQAQGLVSALPDENVDLTVDFALVEAVIPPQGTASLGSTLWVDGNWNGRQDAGEPVIPNANVLVIGPLDENGQGGTVTPVQTGPDGVYFAADLAPGKYQVVIPAEEMNGSGAVAQALRNYYYTLPKGLPVGGPTPFLSTLALSTQGEGADDQTDGDDNGAQPDGFGGEAVSAVIELILGAEPSDGDLPGDENTQPNEPAAGVVDAREGRISDNATDANGDMTLDFGFVHQCATICDLNQDGRVTRPVGSFSLTTCPRDPVTNLRILEPAQMAQLGMSDIGIMYCLNAYRRTWAGTAGPGAGQPGSGDCDGDGRNSGDDATWCGVFVY